MSREKAKGRRLENEVADCLTAAGIPAERVPLSGSLGGKYKADVVIGTPQAPEAHIECKYRENLSMQLWDWLEGVDYLALRRNRKPALIVMPMERFTQLFSYWRSTHV